uniref:Uncharacterized protein n=1 Tax=Arundo donax TaxID=35708 RepID=A0A0A9HH88_ARUDO
MDRVDPDTMIYYLDDLDHKKSLVHWISTARVRFYNCGIIEALTIADRIRKNDGTETYGFVREIIKIICSGESAVHK